MKWLLRLLARSQTRNIVQRDRNSVYIFRHWRGNPMGCCDCGLMHRYDFWVNGDGQLCCRAARDDENTAAIRTVRVFPMSHANPTTPRIDVHPATVRPPDDPRDRDLKFRDRAR